MNQPRGIRDETLTRDETLAMLSRFDIRGGRVDEMLTGLEFPVSKAALYRHLAPYGITRDALIDEMGGSP